LKHNTIANANHLDVNGHDYLKSKDSDLFHHKDNLPLNGSQVSYSE
jgi:hypothetical protein